MTACEMLCGKLPYSDAQLGESPFSAPRFIYQLGHDTSLLPTLPGAEVVLGGAVAVDFIARCLRREETERPTAGELLSHAFLL